MPAAVTCRFFEDYKKNENKAVRVDEVLGAEEAIKAVKEGLVSDYTTASEKGEGHTHLYVQGQATHGYKGQCLQVYAQHALQAVSLAAADRLSQAWRHMVVG